MGFPLITEEIFKLLLTDKFPRKSVSDSFSQPQRPKSGIEEDLKKEERRSILLLQSQILLSMMNFIQNQYKKDLLPEDWAVSKKEQNALINMSYYKSHAKIVPTQTEAPLDWDTPRLNLSLTGNCQIPTKSLGIFANQLRDLLRGLSHSDIFSYIAYKCLQQESMATKVLSRILESLASTINHLVSLASYRTLEIQQARRDAAICSAPKSLSEITKMKLRSTPFISDSLFGGQIDKIYKENEKMQKH